MGQGEQGRRGDGIAGTMLWLPHVTGAPTICLLHGSSGHPTLHSSPTQSTGQ